MGHIGNNGKIAIGAFLSALALLALTGITLHETVFLWFLAASAVAYVACVSEVVIRRRHRTLAASGIGSILFIAFGIAFLRQWGLAFNADPDAMSAPVDSAYPDLYFYLAAASGAATLLLLVAGTLLPGRGWHARAAGSAPRRRPASGTRRPASRPSTPRPTPRPAPRAGAPRTAAPRTAARPAAKAGPAIAGATRATGTTAQPAKAQSARVPAPRAASSGVKRPSSSAGPAAAKSAGTSAARSSARPSPRR
jgi:hypothetical protein